MRSIWNRSRSPSEMGPRDYQAGTREALVHLSDGFCYFPDCERPVVEFVDGAPVMALEIAHISAANDGGPFFDGEMTDDERRHFDNLILLCKPHHTLVDKREPASFPPEVRRRWKADREKGLPFEYRSMLQALTAAGVGDAIEKALIDQQARGPLLAIEIAVAFEAPNGQIFSLPFFDFQKALDDNRTIDGQTLAVVATARNLGGQSVDVESWNLEFGPQEGALIGANHYATQSVPQRIKPGSLVRWRWRLDVIASVIRSAHEDGRAVFDLNAEVILANGTQARSEVVGVEHVPMWDIDMADKLDEARELWSIETGNEGEQSH